MTRTAAFAIAIWGAGLTGVGALAYTVRPTSMLVQPEKSQGNQTSLPAMETTPAPAEANTGVVELPPVFIVGTAVRPVVAPRLSRRGEATEPRCGDWRHLQQGAAVQQVRYCD